MTIHDILVPAILAVGIIAAIAITRRVNRFAFGDNMKKRLERKTGEQRTDAAPTTSSSATDRQTERNIPGNSL